MQKRIGTILIPVLLATSLIAGCGKRSLDLESRYKWTESSDAGGEVAYGITGTEVFKDGKRIARWEITDGKDGNLPFRGYGSPVIVDMPGAHDIRIEIDPDAKSTIYAGLLFTESCILEICEDGTLLADKEGLRTKDKNAAEWVSAMVKLDAQDVIAFFPANSK